MRPFSLLLRSILPAVMGCAAMGPAVAQTPAPHPAGAETPVFTRARVTSIKEEGSGLYIRLKLLPRSKIPFAVQTFRVADRALVAGIAEGSWVRFTAKHVDGENTVTSIHATAECKRFQPCD